MALFEVWQDGECKMGTDYECCIYPIDTLLNMKAAGCTFKYQGKKYVPKKGEEGPYERYKAQSRRK